MGSPAVDGSDRRPMGSCNGAEGVGFFTLTILVKASPLSATMAVTMAIPFCI